MTMISATRNYIVLTETSWGWSRLQQTFCRDAKLKIAFNSREWVDLSNIYTISFYGKGGDGRVVLALNCRDSCLAIVKIFDPPDADKNASQEHNLWRTLWNVDTCLRTVAGSPALIMPFVIAADSNGKFALTPEEWICHHSNLTDAIVDGFESLNDITKQITKCYNEGGHTFEKTAEEAQRRIHECSLKHADIKNEHVALLPWFDRNGVLNRLEPILIDLSRVSEL